MSLGPLFFSPAMLWLAIPVTLALLVARLYRARRRELLAGSLLLWRRLAAEQPKLPPRRWPFDLSFFLQLAALLALVGALSGPTWALGNAHGRELLLVIDNGPLSRATGKDGQPLLNVVLDAARERLRGLKSDDRVYLARSSPSPKPLTGTALSPSEAQSRLGEITPALSGPTAEAVWRFCADQARSIDSESAIRRETISLRSAPLALGSQWRCVAPPGVALDNVGIVAVGSARVPGKDKGESTQLLVRLHNYSKASAAGTVHYDFPGETANDDVSHTQAVQLEADGDAAVVFSIQKNARVRVCWNSIDGKSDAFSADDCIVAAPRPGKPPRVRFYPAPIPALQRLFSEISPPAVIVPANDSSPVDLEIRAGNVPEAVPANTHALMLLSPDEGFQTAFKAPGNVLKQPVAQLGEPDRLTRFIRPSPEALFATGPTKEIEITGALKVLIKDRASNRPLVATLKDDAGRPVYLFTFAPGQGRTTESPLDAVLAALLLEMADEAAGSGEPYVVATAESLEQKRGQPLPQNWTPDAADSNDEGAGVLNEEASRLELGGPGAAGEDAGNWSAAVHSEAYNLAPWLVLLALTLAALELWLSRPKAASRAMV